MNLRRLARAVVGALIPAAVFLSTVGCKSAPTYRELRVDGQREMLDDNVGLAKVLFDEAQHLRPENAYNLHDLGVCSMYLAREQVRLGNYPAAMREVDHAVEYYTRAITSHPGFQAALLGKNRALELKGQFDEALQQAEWAREFVGPSARQQIFLARELEERGDLDGALLRYEQAVAMERGNPAVHAELGKFYHRQNKDHDAVEPLQEAYRLNPNEPGVLALLVKLGAPVPSIARQ